MEFNKLEQKAFEDAASVVEMLKTDGFEKVIQPWLIAKKQESFPDPTNFNNDEEYLYAAKYASIYKKVIGEIIGQLQSYNNTFETLSQKKIKPVQRVGQVVSEEVRVK